MESQVQLTLAREHIHEPAHPLTPRQRERLFRRLVDLYGGDNIRCLLKHFRDGTSLASLERRFGVSPQRLSQWRAAFGERVTAFRVFPEVSRVLPGSVPPEEDESVQSGKSLSASSK